MEYQVTTDPLFKKTSAAFDEGGAKGLLMNNLSVHNGCQIVFDSTDAIDAVPDTNDAAEDDEIDLGSISGATSCLQVCQSQD